MNALKTFTFDYQIGYAYNCGSRVENYFLNIFNFHYGLQLILVTNNALDNGKL